MHWSPGTSILLGLIVFVLAGFVGVARYSKAIGARLTAFVLVILTATAGFLGFSILSRYFSPHRTLSGAIVSVHVYQGRRAPLTSHFDVRCASGEVVHVNSDDFLIHLLNQSQIVKVVYESWTFRAVSIEVISGDRAGVVLTPLIDNRAPVFSILELVGALGLIAHILFQNRAQPAATE
jgi:hypothetical protein